MILTPSNTQVHLSFTNTINGIRNLEVIRLECDPRRPALFTDGFIEHHKKYGTLLFMDWGHTNNNKVSNGPKEVYAQGHLKMHQEVHVGHIKLV